MLTAGLLVAKKMRIPTFQPADGSRTRIERLENYLLDSAFAQGELSEERLDRLVRLKRAQDKWERVDITAVKLRTRTEAGVRDAKRQLAPELYETLSGLEWLVKRLTEEIDRLERDATKVSRAYAMVIGG